MLNLNLSAFQSQELVVEIAVAAVVGCALCASSVFRNIALAAQPAASCSSICRAGVPVIITSLGGSGKGNPGVTGLLKKMVVGLAVSAVLLLGMQERCA